MMKTKLTGRQHYEQIVDISTSPREIFEYVDDHTRFSSHMSRSSWMMGGGKMKVILDRAGGQKVGSHIKLNGKVFGINLFLDEIVTKREPPFLKVWQTVGSPKLLVIGPYEMGIQIKPQNGKSKFKVFINYDLPQQANTRWLGYLFGGMYAKWCVRQMIKGAQDRFTNKSN